MYSPEEIKIEFFLNSYFSYHMSNPVQECEFKINRLFKREKGCISKDDNGEFNIYQFVSFAAACSDVNKTNDIRLKYRTTSLALTQDIEAYLVL
jgi:hypothetical protein